MNNNYIFTSGRLGFRNWQDADISKMTAISSDADVMEYFPAPATPEQTEAFIGRMQIMFTDRGHCYFAVDRLKDNALIGFIGLMYQDYEAPFTPCVDIGWRLGKEFWNEGYATEGAERCIEYGFNELNLDEIIATAPAINKKSVKVMKKAGMHWKLNFIHPRLKDNKRLKDCVCYGITGK